MSVSDGGAHGPVPQDPTNRRADWASSNSDIRHRVNLAATYQLPFGTRPRVCANGNNVVNQIAARIGRSAMRSGAAERPAVHRHRAGIALQHRRQQPGESGSGVDPIPAQQNINQWFNPSRLRHPPAYTWGTLGRDSLNGPRLVNLDFSVSRKIRLRRITATWSFAAEFFNGGNHPQFGLPASTMALAARARLPPPSGPTGRSSSLCGWHSDFEWRQ